MATNPFENLQMDNSGVPPVVNPFDSLPVPPPPPRNETEAEFSSGDWQALDALSGAAVFIEGATLGWSDEALVGIQSLTESAFSDKSLADIYAENKDSYDAAIKDFRQRNPGIAITAELVGAIVSPISKVGMGIRGAKSLGGLVARGGVEGAVAGVGAAERDSNLLQAGLEGATFGAGGTLALGVPAALLKRRIETPLEQDGVFTPITLAGGKEETSGGILQSFYRGVVGPSFGGGDIRVQEEAIVGPLAQRQAEAKKSFDKLIVSNVAEAKEAKDILENNISNIGKKGKTEKENITEVRDEAKEIIKGNYAPLLGNSGSVMNRKTKEIVKLTDELEDGFRIQAVQNSLPAEMPKRNVKTIIEANTPNEALYELEKNWAEHGFMAAKGRSFRVNTDQLIKSMASRATKNDLAFFADSQNQVVKEIQKAAGLLEDRLSKGRISGEDLTNLRSNLGTKAATKSDDGQGVLQQMVYREMQGAIDDVIMSQLKGKGLASYTADKTSWASSVVLKNAVGKASAKAGRQGRFKMDEWIQSIKENSVRQARQGGGPLRQEAEKVASIIKSRTEDVTSAAETLSTKLTKRRDREITRATNKAKLEKASIDKQNDALVKTISKDPDAVNKIAANKQREATLKEAIDAGEKQLSEINKLRTLENPSWFHQLAASGLVGAPAALATGSGPIAGAVGAVGTSKVLTTPTAQKLLAGQLPLQETAQKAQFLGSEALGTVPLAGGRALTGMLTGENGR